MSKRKKSPAYYTLLIPGIFMAVLGSGNIILGTLKHEQYKATFLENNKELNNTNTSEISFSPLQRLKNTHHSSDRIHTLVRKAQARMNLYSLVIYGGKVFFLISLFLLGGALIKKYFDESKIQKTKPDPLTP